MSPAFNTVNMEWVAGVGPTGWWQALRVLHGGGLRAAAFLHVGLVRTKTQSDCRMEGKFLGLLGQGNGPSTEGWLIGTAGTTLLAVTDHSTKQATWICRSEISSGPETTETTRRCLSRRALSLTVTTSGRSGAYEARVHTRARKNRHAEAKCITAV